MASLRRILAVCCIQMGVATSSTLCAHRHSTIELLIYFMYRGKYDDDDDDYSAIDLMTLNNFFYFRLLYTVSTKKVTPCIHCHNSDKQCQILAEFWSSNAMSNCKQITKFK